MVQSITIYSRGSFSSMIEIKIQSFTNKVSQTKARRKFGENHKKRDISKTTRICAVIGFPYKDLSAEIKILEDIFLKNP